MSLPNTPYGPPALSQQISFLYSVVRDVKIEQRRAIHTSRGGFNSYIDKIEKQIKRLERLESRKARRAS